QLDAGRYSRCTRYAEARHDQREWAGTDDHARADHDPADAADLSAGHYHFAVIIHSNHHCLSFPTAGSWHAGSPIKSNSDRTRPVSVVLRNESNAHRDVQDRL